MGCSRQEMLAKVNKAALRELRKDKKLTSKDIRVKAREASEKIVNKALHLANTDNIPDVVASNGIDIKPIEGLPDVVISKDVRKLGEAYLENPNSDTAFALLISEVSHGYRNVTGDKIVNLIEADYIGSSETIGMNSDEFEATYIDQDGTMSKASEINKVLVELDKKNQKENFDEVHSERLTNQLNSVISLVQELQDIGLQISTSDISALTREQGASGYYDPTIGEVGVSLDSKGPGAEFRNNFSMGNQEVFLHEITHAVMDFMFDPQNIKVAKNPELVNLKSTLETLFKRAGKKSSWKTLLPGIDEGVQYSDQQIEQAKDKWSYIFENKKGHGLHEFMAAILTNPMFRKGMESIKAIDEKEIAADEKLLDKLHRMFLNFVSKIVGFATGNKGRNVTQEGASLIYKIMRANYSAVDRVSEVKAIRALDGIFDKTVENIEVNNRRLKRLTDPFIGIVDTVDNAIENKDGVLAQEHIEEFIKLKDEIDKILGPEKKEITSKGLKRILDNVIRVIDTLARFVRALPKIYRVKQLTKNTAASIQMKERAYEITNRFLESAKLMEDGVIRSFSRDFLNRPGMYNYLADSLLRLTHSVDGMREAVYAGVLDNSNDWFGDVNINNDALNIRNNEALSDVVLRTDIQSLGLDTKGLEELLRDDKKVASKIEELKKGLTVQQVNDSLEMASYMVTGEGRVITNAENIARGFGSEEEYTYDKDKFDKETKQIDRLISYMALDMTKDDTKKTLLDFMAGNGYQAYSKTLSSRSKEFFKLKDKRALTEEEYKKKVLEGIEDFIIGAKGAQVASAKEMEGRRYQTIKGYVHETFNTNNELEFHPMYERTDLEKQGYKFIKVSSKIPGSNIEYGMFISNAPSIKRANGALGLQSKKARGTTLKEVLEREANLSEEGWDAVKESEKFADILEETIKKYRKNKDINMIPIYGPTGDIVNFRMVMSLEDKKKYLNLETKGTNNLARTFSVMGTADTTTEHNKDVIDALFIDYEDNYSDMKDRFVEIKPRRLTVDEESTSDNEYERLWARLPKTTKEYAEEVFGGKKIVVRKELLTMAFGEDELTVSKSKAMDRVSTRNKASLRKVESIWQDMMQIAKTNIVIKTPEVLFGNLVSNFKILLYVGVNPVKGAKLLITGARELKKYEADKKELSTLVRDELGGKKVNKVRINELEESIKNNTVSPLVEAGLYQSVVEDVSTADDSNRVAQWGNKIVDKYIPNETANTAIQYMFLTQKTKPYQQLLKMTQVSDFYFRYAQYYDAVQNKGQSEEKALRDATDNYVNYEAPLEKHVRYMDSMGPWFFIKYFTRIQKVVKKIAKDNPLRVGTDIMLQEFVTGDTADVLDVFWLDKGVSSYNPFKVFTHFGEFVSPAGLELPAKYL